MFFPCDWKGIWNPMFVADLSQPVNSLRQLGLYERSGTVTFSALPLLNLISYLGKKLQYLFWGTELCYSIWLKIAVKSAAEHL